MKILRSIKNNIKENKMFLKNNFKCIVIFIIILCIIPVLCKNESFNMIYTKINIFNIINYTIVLSIFIMLFKVNFKFIKETERKIYNIILNIIIPIIIMIIVCIFIFNIINNIAQTNILRFWNIPYIYTDNKYEITFSPHSIIESSSSYTYYIDLNSKEVTRIINNYWISEHRSRVVEQKKIDDSTNNKLINLFKEIDKMEEKQENNNKNIFPEECYYVSTNKYKQKKINYESKSELIKELKKIFY